MKRVGAGESPEVVIKALGLTRFMGLSGHNRPGRFAEAIQRVEIDVLLNVVNFADRHTYNFEERVWTVANRLNLGLIAMKVFGGAQKSGGTSLSHCLMPASHLDAAFRYALSVPQVTCAVIGMATPRELLGNLRRARAFSPLNLREGENLMQAGLALASQWGNAFRGVDLIFNLLSLPPKPLIVMKVFSRKSGKSC